MKNILAKLGSKKVMGAVLVMVTLVVGLGVISNFSGTDQKQANEAALSRFEDNAYNKNFYGNGVSRADLERQLSAQQDRNTARFLRGSSEGTDEDDAYSADGAYAEGVKSDEGFVYGDAGYQGGQGGVNGAYDPSNPMYAQGGVDANGVPYGAEGSEGAYANGLNGGFDENGVPYGAGYAGAQGAAGYSQGGENASSDEAAAEGESSAAAKARKAKQARERANRARRETQINKLANSGGSSSWGSFGGGAGTGGAGAMSMGGMQGDNASRALPSADLDNGANSKAFKLGRGGAMGGYNVARGKGGVAADTGKGGDRSAAQSLLTAARFSSKAVQAQYDEGSKKLAENAFDGGQLDETGNTIEDGADIAAVNAALNDPNNNPGLPDGWIDNPGDDPMAGFKEAQKEFQELEENLTNRYLEMLLMWVVSFVAIWAAVKFLPRPYNYIVGGVLTVAALVWAALIFWGDGTTDGIFDIINKMGDDKFKDYNLITDAKLNKKKWLAIGATIGTVVVLGAAWYSSISSLVKKKAAAMKQLALNAKKSLLKSLKPIAPKPL